MTNFEKISSNPHELAWAILDALRCELDLCDVCGVEDSCPLYGKDWRKILYKYGTMAEMVTRIENWLQEESRR